MLRLLGRRDRGPPERPRPAHGAGAGRGAPAAGQRVQAIESLGREAAAGSSYDNLAVILLSRLLLLLLLFLLLLLVFKFVAFSGFHHSPALVPAHFPASAPMALTHR